MEGVGGNGMPTPCPPLSSENIESPPQPKKAKKDVPQTDKKRRRALSPWRFPVVQQVDIGQAQEQVSEGGSSLRVPKEQNDAFSPDSTSMECCPGTRAEAYTTQTLCVAVNDCAVDGIRSTGLYVNNVSSSECQCPVESGDSRSRETKVDGEKGITSPDSCISSPVLNPGDDKSNGVLCRNSFTGPTEITVGSSSSPVVETSSSQEAVTFIEKDISSTSSKSSPCDDVQTTHVFQRHKLERSDGVYLDGTTSPPNLSAICSKVVSDTDTNLKPVEEVGSKVEENVSSGAELQKDEEKESRIAPVADDADKLVPTSMSSAPTSPSTNQFKVPSSPCHTKIASRTSVDPLVLRSTSPFSPLCSPKVSPQSHGKYTLVQVMAHLEKRIPKLLEIIDYTTSKPLDDLKFVKRRTNYNPDYSWRIHIADKMEELGIVQLLIRIWQSMHRDDGTVQKDALMNILQVVSTLWNTTDISRSLCEKVTRSGAISLFLEDMHNDAFALSELENDEMKLYYVKGIMGIMHNICRHYRDSRDVFRDAEAVKCLQRFLKAENPVLKIKVLILLAYVITEDENTIINADDSNICYIIEILKSAVESEGHFSKKHGFCASELVHGLNHLIANDLNKERVVRNQLLPLYVRLLGLDCKPEEQKFAARGIWILAFNEYCKKRIKEEKGCLEGLQLLISNGTEEGVRHAARGALWEISARWKVSSISHDADAVISEAPHIMISYQWDSKPTMLRVKDRLKAEGYKVWMDVENMSGSTLEAMALAVEKSCVVIMCASQKYKDSPNCRSEAEYTYRLRRSIVPLILQKDYTPDGWLGMMVGTKLYFDFSEEENFDQPIEGLIRELGDRGKVLADGGLGVCDFVGRSVSQESYTTCSNASSPDNTAKSPEATEGTSAEKPRIMSSISEVKKWFEQHGLGSYCDKFEDFNDDLLHEMKRMQESTPDFLYQTLQTEYGFKLRDILLLNRALRKLDTT